ncbi:MAG TPA: ATP-binding protein [Bryobacteraceae bacterium]|jgi:signal transduction histidine kinase|nr:ATP-binding protein [Bryobacteraceae bacterium]
MRSTSKPPSAVPLISLNIAAEGDIVSARRRARHVAIEAGFGPQDQARIATAVSEIARNAFQYAGSGRVEFSIDLNADPQVIWIEVSDQGPGIENLDRVLSGSYESRTGMGIGLSGTRRLMEYFRIQSKPGAGTTVTFGKPLPPSAKSILPTDASRLSAHLPQQKGSDAFAELQRQNQELLGSLELLRERELELEKRERELAQLSLELHETNRGVVALYAELDEAAAALKRADEMKSHFLRYVSHEFRTPVNAVLALTQLLLRRLDGELTTEQEKQVQYIRRAVQDLAEMVNDLLDLAKVEAGKTEVRLSSVDLGQFIGSIRALMRPLATNEAVSLIFDEPQPHVTLETDESKLGQILRNLISNALKFTEAGEVRVSTRLAPSGSVCFSVTDSGVGIAPADLETIFQEFAQVDNRLQKNVRGTGLGLPLSRKLATLLGGTLEASSRPGAGSTFSLTLPCAPNADARPSPQKTILVIDDEEASRYLTRQLFRGSSYRIIEARNGPEGTERARFENPTLILLDLMMPYQNGFNVLDELQSDEATRDIPVVIQTSKNLTDIDYDRLASRHQTILPKAGEGRLQALKAIRRILGEPELFQKEPEFMTGQQVL